MYNFIDVNKASVGAVLPSEALKLNGQYIEDQIPGYRTLNVQGREALSPDVFSYEAGLRDGTRLKSKRYPERIIIVQYQLSAATNEEFREAYNHLGRILDVENAEMIFNDEQDKFFIGTPCIIGSVEPGRNSVVGEIEFLCTDPFKYSLVEYEADMNEEASAILIDYNGTYKAFPTLEAAFYNETEVGADGETAGTLTGNGDCGYVAFFNEREKIVQLGDPAEKDTEGSFPKSQTLMNQTFLTETAWGTTAKKLWTVNAGNTLPVTVTQTGAVAMAAASTNEESTATTSGTLLSKQKSTVGSPYCYYTVSAKAKNRTANSVTVDVAITSALWQSGSYFGNGYGLQGALYIGGAWHGVVLKKTSEYWRGTTGHTVNASFIISGLTQTQTALTGIKFKVDRTDSGGDGSCTLKETACANLSIPAFAAATAETHYMTASSYGSGSGWHGPSITRNLGADEAGEVGAANFTFTYKQRMCIGNTTNATKELGGFHAHLLDASGKTVAGVRIVKTKADRAASLMLFVNNVKVHQVGIDMSHYNKFFGATVNAVETSTIKKSGSNLLFNIGGYVKSFTDTAIADMKVTKVVFMFEQHGTSPKLSYNGIFWAKFIKDNCATAKDIPNKFSANDVVTADCRSGEILLNRTPSPSLGALGNDWEQFYLTPGLNQIGVAFSDWVNAANAPTFKVRYREVFL